MYHLSRFMQYSIPIVCFNGKYGEITATNHIRTFMPPLLRATLRRAAASCVHPLPMSRRRLHLLFATHLPRQVVVMPCAAPPSHIHQLALPRTAVVIAPLSTPQPSPASCERRRQTQRKASAAEVDSGCRAGVKRSSLHLQRSCRHAVLAERSSME